MSSAPTSEKYFYDYFNTNHRWEKIYMLPRIVTKDTCLQMLQYKILTNTLYLNSRLVHFNMSDTPLCNHCKIYLETSAHFFAECIDIYIVLEVFLPILTQNNSKGQDITRLNIHKMFT